MAGVELAKRVLICDDERHIVRLIQANLERQGYEVFVAFTERAALDSFASSKPDMVILDSVMPGFDGFEVLKAIRSDPENELVLVMMFVEAGNEEAFARAFREGANRCVAKTNRMGDFFGLFK